MASYKTRAQKIIGSLIAGQVARLVLALFVRVLEKIDCNIEGPKKLMNKLTKII